MKVSRHQKEALGRLTPYPTLLWDEVIEAFFDFTDKGIKPLPFFQGLPPGGDWQLQELISNHKFGWFSREYEKSVAEDFRTGLLFLQDFDSYIMPYDDWDRTQALRIYKEVFGETTYWRRWKEQWRGRLG